MDVEFSSSVNPLNLLTDDDVAMYSLLVCDKYSVLMGFFNDLFLLFVDDAIYMLWLFADYARDVDDGVVGLYSCKLDYLQKSLRNESDNGYDSILWSFRRGIILSLSAFIGGLWINL